MGTHFTVSAHTSTNTDRPPGEAVQLEWVDHQEGFPPFQERIPTPPVALLHLVRSFQVLQRLLRDVDPPVYDATVNIPGK